MSSTRPANHHRDQPADDRAGQPLGRVFERHRTGSGPASLATIRAAIIAAIQDTGYLHIPEGRRDHTTPAEALCLHGLD